MKTADRSGDRVAMLSDHVCRHAMQSAGTGYDGVVDDLRVVQRVAPEVGHRVDPEIGEAFPPGSRRPRCEGRSCPRARPPARSGPGGSPAAATSIPVADCWTAGPATRGKRSTRPRVAGTGPGDGEARESGMARDRGRPSRVAGSDSPRPEGTDRQGERESGLECDQPGAR